MAIVQKWWDDQVAKEKLYAIKNLQKLQGHKPLILLIAT